MLSWGLLSGRFWPGWFLSVTPSVRIHCYNRKLNITLNFMFHMCDKNVHKCDITCTWPPPAHKLSHLLGPPPPRAWRTLWKAPQRRPFRRALTFRSAIKRTVCEKLSHERQYQLLIIVWPDWPRRSKKHHDLLCAASSLIMNCNLVFLIVEILRRSRLRHVSIICPWTNFNAWSHFKQH